MDKDGHSLQLTKNNVKSIGHKFNDRITDDAVLRVMSEEQQRIEMVFRMAKMVARHSGRKTIKEEDVRLVYTFIDEVDSI